MSIACPRSLRRWISLLVAGAVLLSAVVAIPLPNSVRVSAQGKKKEGPSTGKARKVTPGPPETGAPAFDLPNLDEVRRRPETSPEAPPPISSSARSKRKPLESRNGKRVGDPGTTGRPISAVPKRSTPSSASTRTHHSRVKLVAAPPVPVSDNDFVTNFLTW